MSNKKERMQKAKSTKTDDRGLELQQPSPFIDDKNLSDTPAFRPSNNTRKKKTTIVSRSHSLDES